MRSMRTEIGCQLVCVRAIEGVYKNVGWVQQQLVLPMIHKPMQRAGMIISSRAVLSECAALFACTRRQFCCSDYKTEIVLPIWRTPLKTRLLKLRLRCAISPWLEAL